MTNGGGAYKPGIVVINEELSWARRCHFPRLNGKVTLATRGWEDNHGGKENLSSPWRIGKKNTEPHGGGAFQDKNNNTAAARISVD